MNTVHTDENVIIIIIFLNNLKLTGNFCLVFELIKSLSFLIVCEVIFFLNITIKDFFFSVQYSAIWKKSPLLMTKLNY